MRDFAPSQAGQPPRRAVAAGALPGSLIAETGARLRIAGNRFGLAKTVSSLDGPLTAISARPAREAALDFLSRRGDLFGLTGADVQRLRLANESSAEGLTILDFQQTVEGLDVYQGQVRVILNGSGQVVQATAGDLAPGLTAAPRPALAVERALAIGLAAAGIATPPSAFEELPSPEPARRYFRNPLNPSANPIRLELVVFPFDASRAVPAYRMILDAGAGYEVVVDAATGAPLARYRLAAGHGQGRVWRESPIAGNRELVPFPAGWLPDGADRSTGNNADAYLDRNGDNQPDGDVGATIRAGRAFRAGADFDFEAGEGSTGQNPRLFPAASVTSLFYFVNLAHSYFYELGFDEPAGNFQTDNLGRGGRGQDAVRAEAQDPSAEDNANFFTPPDGMAPRMQMGLFTRGTPRLTDDFDSAYDGQVVVHEYAHGVTNRMVAGPDNVTCLRNLQSAGLGEGWSDYFSISLFNNPVEGAYLSGNPDRGIRRHSYQNYPLTYADLGDPGFQVHADGEIWAGTLWDLRQILGQQVTDRLVLHGLRFTPCRPSMIDARDGVLMADQTLNQGANRSRLWEVFARHGMGFSASGTDGSLMTGLTFSAAFDLPPELAPGNRFPQVTAVVDRVARLGESVEYEIQAADPDGDPVSFAVVDGPDGLTVDPQTGRVRWTAGFTSARAVIAVRDGRGGEVLVGLLLPVVTRVQSGERLVISGADRSTGFAILDVPDSVATIQATLRGGRTDGFLMMNLMGPNRFAFSSLPGPDQTLTIPFPARGEWLLVVEVFGGGYQDIALQFGFPGATRVSPNRRLDGLSGAITSETFYQFTLPEGVPRLTVSTGGGTGDLDLLLRRNGFPTCQLDSFIFAPCEFDEDSLGFTNAESITIDNPQAGEYFVNLNAFEEYANASLVVSWATGDGTPVLNPGGVVNAADFQPVLARGALGSIFGSGFSEEIIEAADLPLPTELAGLRVRVNNVLAPILAVTPEQINFQVPFEIPAVGAAAVTVERGDGVSAFVPVNVRPFVPAVFRVPGPEGQPIPAVIHADGRLVSSANPARPGELLLLFGTGIGQLTVIPPTGHGAPGDPPATATDTPDIQLGGRGLFVHFAGLAPGFAGLAQYNFSMPDALPDPAARTAPLVIRFPASGLQSTVTLAVCAGATCPP